MGDHVAAVVKTADITLSAIQREKDHSFPGYFLRLKAVQPSDVIACACARPTRATEVAGVSATASVYRKGAVACALAG